MSSTPQTMHDRLAGVGYAQLGPGDDETYPVRGVLIGEDDISTGLSGKTTWWPAETLQRFVDEAPDDLLQGKFLKGRAGPEAHKPMEEQAPPDEIIGTYEIGYEEGEGLVYQGDLVDEHIARLVQQDAVEVSPDMYRELGDFIETRDAYRAERILAIPYLTVLDRGALPSNSIEAAEAEQASSRERLSYQDLGEAFSEPPTETPETVDDEIPGEEQVERLQESAAHTPSYSGTSEQDEWFRPAMDDFDTDDLSEIDDHFLVSETGFPPDNFGDLHLPVVRPSGALSREGLQIAKSRAPQTEGVSADAIQQAVSTINRLADEEFGLDWSDDESEQDAATDGPETVEPPEGADEEQLALYERLMKGISRAVFGADPAAAGDGAEMFDVPDDDPRDGERLASEGGAADAGSDTDGASAGAGDGADDQPPAGDDPTSDGDSRASTAADGGSSTGAGPGGADADATSTTTMSNENPYKEQLEDARERIDELKESKSEKDERVEQLSEKVETLEEQTEQYEEDLDEKEEEFEERLEETKEEYEEKLDEKDDRVEKLEAENKLSRELLADLVTEGSPLSAERAAEMMTMQEMVESLTEDEVDEDATQEERLQAVKEQFASPRSGDTGEEQPSEEVNEPDVDEDEVERLAESVMDGRDIMAVQKTGQSKREFLKEQYGVDPAEHDNEASLRTAVLQEKANAAAGDD